MPVSKRKTLCNQNNMQEVAERSAVLSKAVIAVRDRLALSNKDLSKIIGLSEASISRMGNGRYFLAENSKQYQLGVLLVRLFRSLDAISAGDNNTARSWLESENKALKARPIDSIKTVSGLVNALAYLDSRRAPI